MQVKSFCDSSRAVVFDLDGTLLDTAPIFHDIINHQRGLEGQAPVEYARVRAYVSKGARAMTAQFLGHGRSKEEALACLLDDYAERHHEKTALFDGMEAALAELKKKLIPMAVATAKPRRFAEPLLAHFPALAGLPLVCGDDVAMTKPAPDLLVLAAALLQTSSPLICYVGDDSIDVAASRAAGCASVFVRWGYGHLSEEETSKPELHAIDDPGELVALVEEVIEPLARI